MSKQQIEGWSVDRDDETDGTIVLVLRKDGRRVLVKAEAGADEAVVRRQAAFVALDAEIAHADATGGDAEPFASRRFELEDDLVTERAQRDAEIRIAARRAARERG